MHHAPDVPFSSVPPQEQRQCLARVEPIGLRSARPPVDVDARGLHHIALVSRCEAGDEQAAARFVERFGPAVSRWMRLWDVPANDIPDVRLEVFAAALEQIRAGHFEGRSALLTWLFRITM